jgi:hypothetical protein
MRGRNRSKGPNPLTRSYESNGPDVKIRGTAQHIADKYAQLARDAQASGDPVGAENYLQHAEHYYRIIAAAQEQYREQFGGFQRPFDEEGEDEHGGFGFGGERSSGQGEDADHSAQPQPYDMRPDRQDGDRPERPRFDRNDRPERGDRFEGRERFDRGDRQDRGEQRFDRGDRNDRGDRRERFPRDRNRQEFQRPEGGRPDNPREDHPRQEFQRPPRDEQPRFERRERRRDDDEAPVNGLPAFLTNPVRTPIAVNEGSEAEAPSAAETAHEGVNGEANGRYPRARRRRRRPFEGEAAPEGGAEFAPETVEPPPAE